MENPAVVVPNEPGVMVTIGRIVHYVMPDGKTIRPAITVRVWSPNPDGNGCSNLQVFTDGSNDGQPNGDGTSTVENVLWRTSVCFDRDKKPGTWHWPART